MKLPNGDQAIVDETKLRDYCLNHHHMRGKHKVSVFVAACIKTALIYAAKKITLKLLQMMISAPDTLLIFVSNAAEVGSVWIVRKNS